MIIKAEEQTAEEMARRAKTKITRQGVVDNDAMVQVFKGVRNFSKLNNYLILFLYFKDEQILNEKIDKEHKELKPAGTSEVKKTENTPTSKSIAKTKKPITPATGQKSAVEPKLKVPTSTSNKDTTSSHGQHTFDINCSICVDSTTVKSEPTTISTGKNRKRVLLELSIEVV
jgi:hypothetical protein